MSTMQELWAREAREDERYATLAWGGDGTPEAVQPTIDAILANLDRFMPVDGMNVLDIGCGPGRILHRLARSRPTCSFIGMDISPEMVDLGAHDRPDNVGVVAPVLPEAAASAPARFDLIYSVETFQHMPPEAKQAWFQAIAQLLVPGGTAVIQYVPGDPNPSDRPHLNHPEPVRTIAKYVKDAGLKQNKRAAAELDRVHDVWEWLVLTR